MSAGTSQLRAESTSDGWMLTGPRDGVGVVNDFLENRAAQRLERAALWLVDTPQVLVNLFSGHRCAAYR